MADETESRRYRKRKRAKQEEATRQRITEVAVELHRTAGPARTTVTEIADRAGVSRMTVYNHFPTDADLFGACSAHFAARHPLPDPEAWSAVSGPADRLRSALAELYAWYRRTEDMMDRVLRDAPAVPAIGDILAGWWWPFVDRAVDVLTAGKPGDDSAGDRRAAIRLLVDFRTWQLLARSGLDDARAAALAARMAIPASPRTARRRADRG
jgi:AcrR family transcriptional regulator